MPREGTPERDHKNKRGKRENKGAREGEEP